MGVSKWSGGIISKQQQQQKKQTNQQQQKNLVTQRGHRFGIYSCSIALKETVVPINFGADLSVSVLIS